MKSLKNKYKNQTLWIIGKGPSLRYLDKKHIGTGPVITLNRTIIAVEELNLKNDIYSMQKDGGWRRNRQWGTEGFNGWHSPPCPFSGILCDDCKPMVSLKKANLLIHEHESKDCFPDYKKRYVFDYKKIDMKENEYSLITSIYIAKYMGCDKIKIVCCDAHAKKDYRFYEPSSKIMSGGNEHYYFQIFKLKQHLIDIDYEFITPTIGEKIDNEIN